MLRTGHAASLRSAVQLRRMAAMLPSSGGGPRRDIFLVRDRTARAPPRILAEVPRASDDGRGHDHHAGLRHD